jgi:hypothetical protein
MPIDLQLKTRASQTNITAISLSLSTTAMHPPSGPALALYSLAIAATLLYLWTSTLSPRARKLATKLPPGPRPKPLIGNLLDVPSPSDKAEVFWSRHRRDYGPISSLRLPGQVLIIINDAGLCTELMDKRAPKYSGRPRQVLCGEVMGMNEGFVMIDAGERFRSYRRLAHMQLGSFTAVNRWNDQLELQVRRYLLGLLEEPREFVPHIQHLMAALILRIMYGYTAESHDDQLVKLIVRFRDSDGGRLTCNRTRSWTTLAKPVSQGNGSSTRCRSYSISLLGCRA